VGRPGTRCAAAAAACCGRRRVGRCAADHIIMAANQVQASQVRPLTAAEVNTLCARAADAKTHAYAPYSHFRVGAALLLEDGTIVPGQSALRNLGRAASPSQADAATRGCVGCNVENASYGLAICAERTAYVAAIGHGHRLHVRAVAVATCVRPP
jgi:cytidine deaminase